jgi:16S rRNA (adenine1518-N6/adenine1519-N6)-dimethyltransferase
MNSLPQTSDSRERPLRRWGQHWLTDAHLLNAIADAATVTATDTILEIGPGKGHLTRVLAERGARVIAVEVDPRLVAHLGTQFAHTPQVTILHGDILTAPPHAWITQATRAPAHEFKIVANLPYYITSAILRHILTAPPLPRVIVVLVQLEVAQRLVAQPPQMNLLAVSVQFFAQPRLIRRIPAGAFYPRPQVDSALVRLDVYDTPPYPIADVSQFFTLVRAGFGERRKQLRNALAHRLGCAPALIETILTHAQIDPTRRAESLSLLEWSNLYHAFVAAQTTSQGVCKVA